MRIRVNRFVGAACVVALGAAAAAQQPITYPSTRKVDHVDTYHGAKVADPYRWLEDDTSPETAAWVEAQNKVTFAYLERFRIARALPDAASSAQRLREVLARRSRKGEYFFFSKNDGLQNQSVLYIQKGLDGTPEVLIDPNTWSARRQPVPLTTFSAVEGRASTPSTACRGAGPTGRNTTSWSSPRRRRSTTRSSG